MTQEIMPTASDGLMDYTYNALIDLWLDNFALNLMKIRAGRDVSALPKKKGEPMILVGGGPSISTARSLEIIANSGWEHPILVCDKELISSLKFGLNPYVVASVDGHPKIAAFYNDPIVQKNRKRIKAVFNCLVSPAVVKTWHGPIHWFLSIVDNVETGGMLNTKSVTYALHTMSGKSLMSGMGNVGAFLFNLGFALEATPLILVGYDFSEQVSDATQTVYYKSFVNMFKQKYGQEEAEKKARLLHAVEHNPDFNTDYVVNPIWKRYLEILRLHIIVSKQHTINATGGGSIHTGSIVSYECASCHTKMLNKPRPPPGLPADPKYEVCLKCQGKLLPIRCANFESISLEEALQKYA